jgi:hypothetical protein
MPRPPGQRPGFDMRLRYRAAPIRGSVSFGYSRCRGLYSWSSYCSNATRTNCPRVRTPVF